MAKFDIVPGLTFVSRSSWNPGPQPRLGATVPRHVRDRVFIHHTDTEDTDTSPNIWETEAKIFAKMRFLQTCRPDLGLDVPYNFVAFMTTLNDGLYICEGRGEDRDGAHTKGYNTKGVAVSFAGDFEAQSTPNAEIAKRMPLLSKFLGWLRHAPSHPSYGNFPAMQNLDAVKPDGRAVWYHKDVKATDCPGARLIAHLNTVTFDWP